MATVLVTGVSGFAGEHVVAELAERNHEIIGVGHNTPPADTTRQLLKEYFVCDMSDAAAVENLPLKQVDAIINLAGIASTRFDDPSLYEQNVTVMTVIAEKLLELGSHARLVAVSSGAIYDSNQPMPLTETSKLVGNGSPYAQSKIRMEQAIRELGTRGLNYVIARPLNHTGPGQGSGFLVPDTYAKIQAALKSGEPIPMMALQNRRDFTDVRDVAKAYVDLAMSEDLAFDTYNICSGNTYSVQEVLDLLLAETGQAGKLQIVETPMSPGQNPNELRGSFDRLKEETGWEPTILFQQTIHDFVAAASL